METELIRIENISNIKEITVKSIEDNQNSLKNALDYGEKLYSSVKTGEMTEAKDKEIKAYIDMVDRTVEKMNKRRKPITQLFDSLKKGFTSMENSLSKKNPESIIYSLQKMRDDYASKKIEEEKRERERLESMRLLEISKKSLYDDAIEKYHLAVNRAIDENIDCINDLYSSITLKNIDRVREQISNYLETFKLTNYLAKPVCPQNIDEATYKNICNNAYVEVRDKIADQYASEIKGLKDELLLKIPSKKKELEKIEEQKKTDAEAAAKKAAEMAKKDKEAAAKKDLERKKQQDKDKQAEELAKSGKEANNLFETSSIAPVTNAKITKKINVLDKKAFMNIIQFWWTGVGCDMSVEELCKKLGFMVTYAEKEANKNTDNAIDSPYLEWIEDVKAK